ERTERRLGCAGKNAMEGNHTARRVSAISTRRSVATHHEGTPMPVTPSLHDQQHYEKALAAVRQTLRRYEGCSEEEKSALEREFSQLQEMTRKLETGRVEIAVFGEINTGKSALINALIGQPMAQVDVRG